MEFQKECKSWCDGCQDGECTTESTLHRGGMRSGGFGFDSDGFYSHSDELMVRAAADGQDEDGECDGTDSVWVNFADVSSGSIVDRASFETDWPGMRTVRAQLGRFIALVRSSDAYKSGLSPSGKLAAAGSLTGVDPGAPDLDLCEPWCADHEVEGCKLRMTLGVTVGREPENRFYEARESTVAANGMLEAQARYARPVAGKPGIFRVQLDCVMDFSDGARSEGRIDTAVLGLDMTELKRIHTRLGAFLDRLDLSA